MTNRADWLALAERCEKAEGPAPVLDAEITAALHNAELRPYPPATDFGPCDRWQFWSRDGHHFLGSEHRFKIAPVTVSLDAITALIREKLPGCGWLIGYGRERATEPLGGCAIYPTLSAGSEAIGEGEAASLALAACAAFCRAMAEQVQ